MLSPKNMENMSILPAEAKEKVVTKYLIYV